MNTSLNSLFNITVTFPDLTTTSPLPLASEKSTIQTSPSHTVSHTAVTIPTSNITAPSPSAIEKSTTAPLPTTKPGLTNGARKEESSGEGKDAIILSLAVVGSLLLLGVVIWAVLWCRERSARLSQDKKNTGFYFLLYFATVRISFIFLFLSWEWKSKASFYFYSIYTMNCKFLKHGA